MGNQPGNGGPEAKPSQAKWRVNTEAACCSCCRVLEMAAGPSYKKFFLWDALVAITGWIWSMSIS